MFWFRKCQSNGISPDDHLIDSRALVLARCTRLWCVSISSAHCYLRFSTGMSCKSCLCVHTAVTDCFCVKNKTLTGLSLPSGCSYLHSSYRMRLCDCLNAGKKVQSLCDSGNFGAFVRRTPCGLKELARSLWSCSDWQSQRWVHLWDDSDVMRQSPVTGVAMNDSEAAMWKNWRWLLPGWMSVCCCYFDARKQGRSRRSRTHWMIDSQWTHLTGSCVGCRVSGRSYIQSPWWLQSNEQNRGHDFSVSGSHRTCTRLVVYITYLHYQLATGCCYPLDPAAWLLPQGLPPVSRHPDPGLHWSFSLPGKASQGRNVPEVLHGARLFAWCSSADKKKTKKKNRTGLVVKTHNG